LSLEKKQAGITKRSGCLSRLADTYEAQQSVREKGLVLGIISVGIGQLGLHQLDGLFVLVYLVLITLQLLRSGVLGSSRLGGGWVVSTSPINTLFV
jgi:hypothetical protein